MAIYILIEKVSETSQDVIYRFSVDHSDNYRAGTLRIFRDSGEVELIEPMKGDTEQRHFMRSAFKLRQHYQENQFPEKTCWAS